MARYLVAVAFDTERDLADVTGGLAAELTRLAGVDDDVEVDYVSIQTVGDDDGEDAAADELDYADIEV